MKKQASQARTYHQVATEIQYQLDHTYPSPEDEARQGRPPKILLNGTDYAVIVFHQLFLFGEVDTDNLNFMGLEIVKKEEGGPEVC